jgi:hypothetical protein
MKQTKITTRETPIKEEKPNLPHEENQEVIANHKKAAKHHEEAAKHHHEAAKRYEGGSFEKEL